MARVPRVSRAVVWSLFAMLVVVWSSTWVAIRLGLDDTPPLLGAGVRFTLAGVVLLAITAARRRPLRTDVLLAALLGLLPFGFAYGLIYTRPDMCAKEREKCLRVVRALAAANRMILDKPDEALEILKKRFDKMDQQVLAAAWQTVSKAHAKDLRVTVPGLDHSQKVSLEAKLLEPKNELKSFDGLYTDEFVK